MNQAQRKYAAGRLTSLAAVKKAALTKSYKVQAVTLTKEEKVGLINSGGVKAKVPMTSNPYYLKDFFDFSEFENHTYVKDGYEDACKLVDKALNEALDIVYLGGEEEALAVIINFDREIIQ